MIWNLYSCAFISVIVYFLFWNQIIQFSCSVSLITVTHYKWHFLLAWPLKSISIDTESFTLLCHVGVRSLTLFFSNLFLLQSDRSNQKVAPLFGCRRWTTGGVTKNEWENCVFACAPDLWFSETLVVRTAPLGVGLDKWLSEWLTAVAAPAGAEPVSISVTAALTHQKCWKWLRELKCHEAEV